MATLLAKLAFDYTLLDLSGLSQSTDWGFDNNVNETLNGVQYEDILWFEEGPEAVGFGGTGITMNGEQVTGGTVTGVVTEQWTGTAWARDWYLQGFSVPAVSVYNAALSADKTDDLALVSQVLSGADTFTLSNFNDNMRGFAGHDLMLGNRGNDRLAGDGGNDTLCGGGGADTLAGNAGADVFDYNLATDSGPRARDVITDFVRGVDRIDLSGIDANAATAGTNQAFTGFIRASADFTRAGQLKFVDGVLFGNTDADATAEFAIVLTGVTGLAVSDLVL